MLNLLKSKNPCQHQNLASTGFSAVGGAPDSKKCLERRIMPLLPSSQHLLNPK